MTHKNPPREIKECELQIRKNNKNLDTMILSEHMKQTILEDNIRLEKIKKVAQGQLEVGE